MNIDELALKVFDPLLRNYMVDHEYFLRVLNVLFAEYEAAGSEPVARVVKMPAKYAAGPKIEWLDGATVSLGMQLYARPDPRVAELEAEVVAQKAEWNKAYDIGMLVKHKLAELEDAITDSCMEVESCLDKSPAVTLKNLKDYWFSAGMEEQQSVLETARIAELSAALGHSKELEKQSEAVIKGLSEGYAELEQESTRLKSQIAIHQTGLQRNERHLLEQLALAQAESQRLREVIDTYLAANDPSEFGCACDLSVGHLCAPCFADKQQSPLREALATPLDSSALEAIVQKAGEVMRERCWQTAQPEDSYQDEWFKAKADSCARIRALPSVTLEALRPIPIRALAARRESGEWKPELGD